MSTPSSRRRFLARAAGGLLGSRLGRSIPALAFTTGPAAPELKRLGQLFDDPPLEARPMTRWWWFGGAVTPAEITRELTMMRDAGLGGAEIQPVYPVTVDDAPLGIRHLRYFADEWFGVVRHAVREARRLGLQLDFTLGSGWPYGGPFIPTSLAARGLRVLSQDLVGPRSVSWDLAPHLTGDDRVVAVVAAPVLANQGPDLGRAQELADRSRKAGDGVSGAPGIDWSAPAGEWRLFVFLDSPTGQQVKRPTLGMEGSVLDHFSSAATKRFLEAAGDGVVDRLGTGAPPFRSVFCDSLEVYGADWTEDLLEEFRARRGYDLATRLPALWQEAGPDTRHVRYDYHQTLSDLFLERFVRPLVAWSERRGMTARIQAHGALGDVMRAYGVAHVPEGESIFGGDRYAVNLRHRRLASSAAHVYGKPLASAETYTWLRTPLYTTTLEMMKGATDSMFLDGINHLVNHGYSYSPPEAGEPGWAFYASTEINHTNTWWRHYPHLARYVRRVQALLRHGAAVNPVAVYLPLADVYARHGAGGLHVDVEVERQLGVELLSSLRVAGYDFDLIHDHALAELARVEQGHLRSGTAAYFVVIVPPTHLMPAASLGRLEEFARRGGHILFVGRLPEGAPGLGGQPKASAEVLRCLDRLWGGRKPASGDRVAVGAGSVALAADHAEALARLEAVLAPDFQIVDAGDGAAATREAAARDVGFVHRRAGAVDWYLVANVSARAQNLRARFAVGHRTPQRWDPETGARPALAYEYVSAGGHRLTEVELRLQPNESCFMVFGPSADVPLVTRTTLPEVLEIAKRPDSGEVVGRVHANGEYTVTPRGRAARSVRVDDVPPALRIEGPWTLVLGEGSPSTLDLLVSWAELPAGRTFSGWGRYETEFELGELGHDMDWEVDLGEVHETAEVTLNGTSLGAAWKAPRRVACGQALRARRNRLSIAVANLWIHHMITRPTPPEWMDVEKTFGIRWGRYGEVKPDTLPPAGLLGPVRLVPRKRVRVRL